MFPRSALPKDAPSRRTQPQRLQILRRARFPRSPPEPFPRRHPGLRSRATGGDATPSESAPLDHVRRSRHRRVARGWPDQRHAPSAGDPIPPPNPEHGHDQNQLCPTHRGSSTSSGGSSASEDSHSGSRPPSAPPRPGVGRRAGSSPGRNGVITGQLGQHQPVIEMKNPDQVKKADDEATMKNHSRKPFHATTAHYPSLQPQRQPARLDLAIRAVRAKAVPLVLIAGVRPRPARDLLDVLGPPPSLHAHMSHGADPVSSGSCGASAPSASSSLP